MGGRLGFYGQTGISRCSERDLGRRIMGLAVSYYMIRDQKPMVEDL
jgi:hypothetical protein